MTYSKTMQIAIGIEAASFCYLSKMKIPDQSRPSIPEQCKPVIQGILAQTPKIVT
jgi:hypothetical protein